MGLFFPSPPPQVVVFFAVAAKCWREGRFLGAPPLLHQEMIDAI